MDRRRRMMQERKARQKKAKAQNEENNDAKLKLAAVAEERRRRLNADKPPELGRPREVVDKKVYTYFWPEATTSIPKDLPYNELQRLYGTDYRFLPPMDPVRTVSFKADIDLHRMEEKDLLSTFARDISVKSRNLRTKLLGEMMNCRDRRLRLQRQSARAAIWQGEPAADERDVIQRLHAIMVEALGRAGYTTTDEGIIRGASHACVALDRRKRREHMRTITCFKYLEEVMMKRAFNPTPFEQRAFSGDGKTYKKHTIDFSTQAEMPDFIVDVLITMEGLNETKAKAIAAKGPVSVLACFLEYGGYVTQTAAAAVAASCAKVMEISEALSAQTIRLLLPFVEVDIPECRQLAAVVALHLMSSWPSNRWPLVNAGALNIIGGTLTDRVGGTCAMVHERATLTMLALCEDEEIRRRAFRIGLHDILLHSLQNGLSAAATEAACYCITLLILLQDRQIIRACVPAVTAMLHQKQRFSRIAALRCIAFMAHTEEERKGFVSLGLIQEIVDVLRTGTQFELMPHALRALLALSYVHNVPIMIREAGAREPLSRLVRSTNRVVKDNAVQLLLRLDEISLLQEHTRDPYINDLYGGIIDMRESELKYQKNMLGQYEKDFDRNELAEIRDRFQEFDEDGGGSIDKHELKALLIDLGYKVNKAKCKALVQEVALGDDKAELEWAEFIHLMHNLKFKPTMYQNVVGAAKWLFSD